MRSANRTLAVVILVLIGTVATSPLVGSKFGIPLSTQLFETKRYRGEAVEAQMMREPDTLPDHYGKVLAISDDQMSLLLQHGEVRSECRVIRRSRTYSNRPMLSVSHPRFGKRQGGECLYSIQRLTSGNLTPTSAVRMLSFHLH